jgi:hypothetical protein
MQAIFDQEAKKYNVLPLDNSTLARWNTPRPSLTAGRLDFTYSSAMTGVPGSAAPHILDRSYTITADVDIPKGSAEGMIVTEGGRFGGYGLYLTSGYNYWLEKRWLVATGLGLLIVGLVLTWLGQRLKWSFMKRSLGYAVLLLGLVWAVAASATWMFGLGKGKPVFVYNLLDLKRTVWEGPALSAGKHTIVFDFKSDGPGLGKGGTGVLLVDGQEVAKNHMENTIPVTFPEDESFDIGQDTRTGVALLQHRYDVPFKFTGTINKVNFKLEPLVTASNQKQVPMVVSPDDQRPTTGN